MIALALSAQTFTVSVQALLPQMVQYEYLTRAPKPPFTMAQASSYDRASNPGPHQDWFANGDSGQFVRTELHDGRTEQVMADLPGPGAVVRVWSANPQGKIRFYFDGEDKPRIEENMEALLDGKTELFKAPFAYPASGGHDLYFPIPYAKSLRVTAEGTKGLYYHLGYRTYPADTATESFRRDDLTACKAEIDKVGSDLTSKWSDSLLPGSGANVKPIRLVKHKESVQVERRSTSGEVYLLSVRVPFPLGGSRVTDWSDPKQAQNVLRKIILEISFDGETTVRTPLGDFFCTAPGLHPLDTKAFEVYDTGRMNCLLPMPFRKNVELRFKNLNDFDVPIQYLMLTRDRPFSDDTYLFHAQWTGEHGHTRPFHDMNLLTAKGEGYWVGCNLQVANPTGAWWGEGDEKVFVDKDTFPSTFGTGTEDFFGYAWSSPEKYERPFHAQPYAQGPGNYGHASECRFQLFDPIPFTQSLKFNLECWHWEDVIATYVHTAYWYAKPHTTQPAQIDEPLLLPPDLSPPKPVRGAIEGESLKILSVSGGQTQVQEGFFELSDNKQLWWTDPAVGDRLVLEVPVAKAGRYEVMAHCCSAGDYGIHKITLDGHDVAPIDFFHEGVKFGMYSLGTFDLPAGKVQMTVECVGANPKAEPRHMFGLDYLVLNRR